MCRNLKDPNYICEYVMVPSTFKNYYVEDGQCYLSIVTTLPYLAAKMIILKFHR